MVGGRSELKLKLGIKMSQSIAPTHNIPPRVKGDCENVRLMLTGRDFTHSPVLLYPKQKPEKKKQKLHHLIKLLMTCGCIVLSHTWQLSDSYKRQVNWGLSQGLNIPDCKQRWKQRFPKIAGDFSCICQPSVHCFDNSASLIIISALLRASNVHLSGSQTVAWKLSISTRSSTISPSSFGEMNLPVFSTLSAIQCIYLFHFWLWLQFSHQ